MEYETALSILGVSSTVKTNASVVRRAYLRKALDLHPDRQRTEEDRRKAHEDFVRLREAYDVVMQHEGLQGDVDGNMNDVLLRAFQGENVEQYLAGMKNRPSDMFGIDLTVPFDAGGMSDPEARAEAECMLREWLEDSSSSE